MWTDGSGNHSWVEVWDGARWRYTGAAEPSGDRLDEGWFGGRAAGQNRAKPEHAIYAVTWRDTGVEFPMVFDPSRPRARAVDVTDRYTAVARALPEGHAVLRVCVRDPRTGLRVAAEVEVRDARDASVAKGLTKDERFDLNDHLEVVLPADSWTSFLVNGVRAQEVAFVARDGRAVQAVVTMPAADAAGDRGPRSSPGAVRGADDGFLIDGGFMPPEVIAARSGLAADGRDDEDDIGGAPAGTDGAAKAGKPGAAAIRDMQRFLKDGAVADVAKQPFAAVPLTEEEATRALARLRKSFEDEVRRGAKAEFESKVLEADGAKMPFWYAVYGDKPKSGRSLFISMHGGGGAPKEVNDKQWDNQKRLYKPEEGVYVAPRAPTDTWNLWHQGHIDTLFRKLITDMVVFEGVNPDRVYIMGYSAGGDGVYQLAPRMADSFAAAAMMAGHPNETRPDGLRNIPFALFMGGKDAAFSRNDIARQWKTTLAGLAEKDPGGYTHEVTIYEENGHWMDRKDAVGVPWMAKFTRNLHPTKVVWLQDDVTSPRFYWLANAQPKGGQRVVAVRDRQTITIEEATGVEELTILLDDDMVDLDAPVKVVVDGATAFEGVVPRTLGTAARTLAERGDPHGIFLAEVRVKIPAKGAN
jgi:predicted esterase